VLIKKCSTLFSRCDIFLRSIIQFFFEFFTKGPHLFYVIANTKEGGGLLVATTMAIHLEEPVISAFLIES
jgi:hypothetical protein